MTTLKCLRSCLDQLEEQEATLLTWGDTGGTFSRTEVLNHLSAVAPLQDPSIIMEALLTKAMLFKVPHAEGLETYRTRMGETAFLLRHSRQWMWGSTLAESRPLVADYRFLRRARAYPKREGNSTECLVTWQKQLDLSKEEHSAAQALLTPLDTFRLAGFQIRATERILKAWHHLQKKPAPVSGTIVCAGTGSGKTLAFYLPALTALVGEINRDPQRRVRILALYPRKELLKDQFNETWVQCRKLDGMLPNGRKLKIGALFGDTPFGVKTLTEAIGKRQKLHYDLLRCVTPACPGQMVWNTTALSKGKASLLCSAGCGHAVDEDEVGLTRMSLQQESPDILFTTTEMLNQNLGNHWNNHLFGIGPVKGPTLVLLDEVHTYGGNAGANLAFLLRRWMKRAEHHPHFVGLSATLADGANFFAQLVGAQPGNVHLVEPRVDEMEYEGAEYLMVLRGDPVSQAALFSTTIQSTMLLQRMMDDRREISNGSYGNRTFVFADDLDAINRLYKQVADAEGWKIDEWSGALRDAPHHPLAWMRRKGFHGPCNGFTHRRACPIADERELILFGQDWQAVQSVRQDALTLEKLKIGRTTSQDAGVNADADVVVASASLEVGFNDPRLGAVVQHKAPRDVASYLQRKGRAGRTRAMRPWMLLILSDFGRDRVAYQRYEELLSPEVKRQGLPIHNGHIQKMQGAMATLDWLSLRLGSGNLWSLLHDPRKDANNALSVRLRKTVEALLEGQELGYRDYLKGALGLPDEDLQKVMWAAPRSLMLEFLPMLWRNLTTDWRRLGKPGAAVVEDPLRSPLPEFIPDALFSDLNLPNLKVGLEGAGRKPDALPFYQGLREFAPGRISKRYAVKNVNVSDWLIPTSFESSIKACKQAHRWDLLWQRQDPWTFPLLEAFGPDLTYEGEVRDPEHGTLAIYRPAEMRTRNLGSLPIAEKSNAQSHWGTCFRNPTKASGHPAPKGPWQPHLEKVEFFLHQQMTPLEMIRYCTGSEASMRLAASESATPPEHRRGTVQFTWSHEGLPCAIGNRQWVDGWRLGFAVADTQLRGWCQSPELQAALRPAFLRWSMRALPRFEANSFLADWVTECLLAALACDLLRDGPALGAALAQRIDNLTSTPDGIQRLQTIPLSLFRLDQGQLGELHKQLIDCFAEPELLTCVRNSATALWADLDGLPGYWVWVKEVLANTLAAATQQTLFALLADYDERTVIADSVWQGDRLDLWLSELEPGGSGVILSLSEAYFSDPTRVLNQLANQLEPSDYEQLDGDLYMLLEAAGPGTPLADHMDLYRQAQDHQGRQAALTALRKALQDEGFQLSHSFLAVLHSRVLRPGSSSHTDAELLDLMRRWRALEADTGFEWQLNVAAHALAGQDCPVDQGPDWVFDRFCKNLSLLWPRGFEIRRAELNHYNQFQNSDLNVTERLLGARLLSQHCATIQSDHTEWLQDLHVALARDGRARLRVPRARIPVISEFFAAVQANPIDYRGMLLYPRAVSLRRWQGAVTLQIELAEAVQ